MLTLNFSAMETEREEVRSEGGAGDPQPGPSTVQGGVPEAGHAAQPIV